MALTLSLAALWPSLLQSMSNPSSSQQNVVQTSAPSADVAPRKQSFRKRLFSNTKASKTAEEPVIEVAHTAENSGSTSTTLHNDPLASVDAGLVPSSTIPPPVKSLQLPASSDEQSSLNTSLTAHRAASSEGALSSSSVSHSLDKQNSKRKRSGKKPNFLSRVVLKVVPCVGSDSNHIPDPEKRLATQPTAREKSNPKATPKAAQAPPPTLNIIAPLSIPPSLPTSTSLSSSNAPPSPAGSDVIVPPPHLLPEDETDGLTSGAVQPPGSTGSLTPNSVHITHHHHHHNSDGDGDDSDGTSFTDDEADEAHQMALDEQAEEDRLIRNGGAGIPVGPDGTPKPLLPPIAPEHVGRKCLVLDLDETLVHSSFKPVPQADFIVPVEIEYHWHHFHILKRPGVDTFLQKMGELYEVVIFTASLSKYADPVLDKLDIHQVVAHRLFRESCYNHKGNYVKDLSQLGRPIADTIILDNSPASYIFHPNNAVPVSSWFNDPHDAELTDLIPFLADLTAVPDIRGILDLESSH